MCGGHTQDSILKKTTAEDGFQPPTQEDQMVGQTSLVLVMFNTHCDVRKRVNNYGAVCACYGTNQLLTSVVVCVPYYCAMSCKHDVYL